MWVLSFFVLLNDDGLCGVVWWVHGLRLFKHALQSVIFECLTTASAEWERNRTKDTNMGGDGPKHVCLCFSISWLLRKEK